MIETVIYSALLAIFLSATFLFLNNILSTSGDIIERNELAVNKELLDYKLHWLFETATNVTTPVAGASAGTVTITGPTAVYPAVITLNNGQLMLSLSGAAANPITNNRVNVTSFSATQIGTSALFREMRIVVSLQSRAKANIMSTNEVFTYELP